VPRRKGNHVHDRAPRRRGHRAGSAPRPIDWAYIEAIEGGPRRPTVTQPKARNTEENHFTRNIIGFSPETVELMQRGGLANVHAGYVAVHFSGITESPKRKSPYTKPSIVKTPGGLVVLTGLVEAAYIDEVGRGSGPITQVDAPDLDSHDAPRRLNVVLGQEQEGFNESAIIRALAGETALSLSMVSSINERPVDPSRRNVAYEWNGRSEPSSYSSRWY
jgi:hypothetical protein